MPTAASAAAAASSLAPAAPSIDPPTDRAVFAARRDRLAAAMGRDAIAVLPAARPALRNGDVDHAFRQDSDFYYLSGFEEPEAVAVLQPGHERERYVLFVRPRDEEREMWDGRRAGVDGACQVHGADAAYPIDRLDEKLREYLLGRERLLYRLGNPAFDGRVTALLEAARRIRQRLGFATPLTVVDPGQLLDDLRLVRPPEELAAQRRACALTAEAHAEAMRYARPGLHEYQVQAALEFVLRTGGSPRDGYGAIVASGGNACTLHYQENRRRLEDGDLLLIDAGGEVGYHTADVTRTFPVNGRFSPAQRRVYELVLAAERAGIAAARPGAGYQAIHDAARRVLCAGLCELGLLPVQLDAALAMHLYREFYPHGTGHWLGMDVHDVGAYRQARAPRPLRPGMVLTVEPGLYFAPGRDRVTFHLLEFDEDERAERRYRLGAAAARSLEREERERAEKVVVEIPAEYRGIGVRIEDDVLITAAGNEVLTAAAPTAVADVERTCAERSRLPVA